MRPLPVADKGSNKSFVAVKIFELMKCDKNFGYCTADGKFLLAKTRGILINRTTFINIYSYILRRKHGGVVPFFRVAKERHHRIPPPQAVPLPLTRETLRKSGGCNKLQFPLITPLTFVKQPRFRISGFLQTFLY